MSFVRLQQAKPRIPDATSQRLLDVYISELSCSTYSAPLLLVCWYRRTTQNWIWAVKMLLHLHSLLQSALLALKDCRLCVFCCYFIGFSLNWPYLLIRSSMLVSWRLHGLQLLVTFTRALALFVRRFILYVAFVSSLFTVTRRSCRRRQRTQDIFENQ